MRDTKELLRETRDRIAPPPDVLRSLERRRHHREQLRRGSAAVVAVVIALVGLSGGFVIGRDAAQVPADEPTPTTLRRGAEFIVFTPREIGAGWDLAAQDPETGGVRTIVESAGIVDGVDTCSDQGPCTNYIKEAEWSADGRWVAFEVTHASLDGSPLAPCGPTVGIWVQGPDGGPRQLTTPCDDTPPSGSDGPIEEMWEWSPVDARLVYARIDGETDDLFVIDPSDGARTSLGTTDIRYTTGVRYDVQPAWPTRALEWSPDGARVAYADGNAVYVVEVDGGERSLLSDSFDDFINIAWSPDGTQIMVHDPYLATYRIQVMNADGSDLHVLLEGEDVCCEMAWSPNGDRIAYVRSVGRPGVPERGQFSSEVWTVAPDGSNPIKVFDSGSCAETNTDALPVWAPNGTQVAYNACGEWVVANSDGTGEPEPIDELVWRSWYSGGLSQWDLAGIGQLDD